MRPRRRGRREIKVVCSQGRRNKLGGTPGIAILAHISDRETRWSGRKPSENVLLGLGSFFNAMFSLALSPVLSPAFFSSCIPPGPFCFCCPSLSLFLSLFPSRLFYLFRSWFRPLFLGVVAFVYFGLYGLCFGRRPTVRFVTWQTSTGLVNFTRPRRKQSRMKVDAKWDFTLRNEMATRKGLAQVYEGSQRPRNVFKARKTPNWSDD